MTQDEFTLAMSGPGARMLAAPEELARWRTTVAAAFADRAHEHEQSGHEREENACFGIAYRVVSGQRPLHYHLTNRDADIQLVRSRLVAGGKENGDGAVHG